jgi:cytochrome c biogenesis protein CcmG/thiol:disulfide interchange protein DsbE
MNRTVVIVGLVIFAALVGVLFFALGKDPQAIDSPLVGKPAPPFALKQAGSGATLDLAQFRGKPVVINFWATWCVPCYQEHPVLTQAAQIYGGQVQFIGVVFDDAEGKILDFLRQNGGAYPTLMDQGGKTSIAYGVGGVPETFFLDRNGTIVAKYTGPLTPELMQEYVAQASR